MAGRPRWKSMDENVTWAVSPPWYSLTKTLLKNYGIKGWLLRAKYSINMGWQIWKSRFESQKILTPHPYQQKELHLQPDSRRKQGSGPWLCCKQNRIPEKTELSTSAVRSGVKEKSESQIETETCRWIHSVSKSRCFMVPQMADFSPWKATAPSCFPADDVRGICLRKLYKPSGYTATFLPGHRRVTVTKPKFITNKGVLS